MKIYYAIFATISSLLIFDSCHAASRRVKPSEVFEVIAEDGQTIVCARFGKNAVSGSVNKKGAFRSANEDLKLLNEHLRKVQRQKSKKAIASLKKKIKELSEKIAKNNTSCNQISEPTPTPTPTPLPEPSSDAVSMAPLERALTNDDIRSLVERAGFGMSSNEEPLIALGAEQGISVVVDSFMESRSEDSSLIPRVLDRLDQQLGKNSTQTPSGQRAALIDLWIHTKNPFAERLALSLLGIWTVAGDVISDETFRGAFWDYYDKLRQASYQDVEVPFLGLALSRDPLMLVYLNNDLNVKGSPNENFARELMELFTLGPVDLDGNPNYTETQIDGSGDIAVAARMLTGWKTTFNYTNNKIIAQYQNSRHQNGPHTMFKGKPYQFNGENDHDLILGIFSNHPAVKNYYARELIKEYLTPDPSRELIEQFGAVIAANQFKLRPALATLFKSKAFYHAQYRDSLPKNSIEFAVEIIRTLKLEDACDVLEVSRQVANAGMAVNESPSVFWFSPTTWTSPAVALERANLIAQLFTDSTSLRLPEPDWTPSLLIPPGALSSTQLLNHISSLLGISGLGSDTTTQLVGYINSIRQWNGTFTSLPYNNLDATHQRRKGVGLIYILSSTPQFQLK